MKKWLWAANAANALDCFTTIVFTSVAGLREVNPLMKALLDIHPSVFFVVKMLVLLYISVSLFKRNKIAMLRFITILLGSVATYNVVRLFYKYDMQILLDIFSIF